MAKVTLGSALSEIRGTVAGVTYSRNQYGAYSYGKIIQTNPDSPLQQGYRGNMATSVAAWQALTDGQRLEWEFHAKNVFAHNNLYNHQRLNGYNYFIKCCLVDFLVSFAPPPLIYLSLGVPKIAPVTVTLTTSVFTVKIDVLDWVPNWNWSIKVSGPRSPGTSSINPSLNIQRAFDQLPFVTQTADLKAAWQTVYGGLGAHSGKKIFFEIRLIEFFTGRIIVVQRFFDII